MMVLARFFDPIRVLRIYRSPSTSRSRKMPVSAKILQRFAPLPAHATSQTRFYPYKIMI